MTSSELREKNITYVKPPKDGKALFFKVPSFSSPGSLYLLRVMPSGEVKCSCKANAVGGLKCRHIKDFLTRYNEDFEKLAEDIDSKELVKEEPLSTRYEVNTSPSEFIEILPGSEI